MDDRVQPTSMQKQIDFEDIPISPTSVLAQESPAPTRAFTLFPNLPLELRLAIWHLTFPKTRRIQLCDRYHQSQRSLGRPSLLIPVTMWVHRESRIETLKHYCLFEGPSIPGSNKLALVVFNPSQDDIYLPFDEMFPGWGQRPAVEIYLSTLSRQAPRQMEKIRQLRISGVSRIRIGFDIPKLFSLVISESGSAIPCYPGAYSSAVFHFPALRKIILEFRAWRFHEQEINIMTDSVRAFVELHREKFTSGEAPQVVSEYL